MSPAGQPPLGAHLHGAEPELVQADRLGASVVDVVELRVGGAVPALQDVVDRRQHGVVAGPAVVHGDGQPVGIEIDPRRVDAVAVARPTR